MNFPFNLIPGFNWLELAGIAAGAAIVVTAVGAWNHHERGIGRDEVQALWNREKAAQIEADSEAARSRARESLRRYEKDQEAQDANRREVDAARADAARAHSDADGVREQSAGAARQWVERAADPGAPAGSAAAAQALGVCTDVLGRVVARAELLAAYSDAARQAGELCERYSDTLIPPGAAPAGDRPP